MVWTRRRAYPNIPADVRPGSKYRWDVEILPDARSSKTSTRLGEPERLALFWCEVLSPRLYKMLGRFNSEKKAGEFTGAFLRKVFGTRDRRAVGPIVDGALEARA